MANKKLRVGIAGKRGVAFITRFLALPQVEVVALCETDEKVLQELAQTHHIPQRFHRFADMLDADEFEEYIPETWCNPPAEAIEAGHCGGDYFQIRDFMEAVLTGAPPEVDIYTALEWTASGLCSQIWIQDNSGPIKVPDFRDPAQRPIILDAPPVVP